MKIALPLLLSLFLLPQAFANRVILLTGYWPPTNEMLREFSSDPKVNPGGWKGKNWKNSGYDIHAYFPEFADAKDRVGSGPFPVDFASTFNDFMRITAEKRPALILSFGNGVGPWEVETIFPAHYKNMFVSEKLPSFRNQEVLFPIPESLKSDQAYPALLPFEEILKSVNSSSQPHLIARIDNSDDAGDFLCGFIGYLGGWYFQQMKSAPLDQRMYGNGFIHVSGDLEKAKVSLEKTLEAVLPTLPQ